MSTICLCVNFEKFECGGMINQIRGEMIYARRFGAFLPFLTLATTLIVTYLVKQQVESWWPDCWQIAIVFVSLAMWLGMYCLVYALILISIRFGATSHLRPRLQKRLHEVFASGTVPNFPAEDYADRAADLQTWISMPSLVRSIVADLLSEKKTAYALLQRTIDQFTETNELRAFLNLLGNQWKLPKPFVIHPAVLVDDPVHGCITLDSDLSTIIAQPIIQRLSRVRQLSFSYNHFPSATHSRLSHVLGVAHNVECALTGIFSRGVYYEEGAPEPVKLPKDILDQRDQIIRKAKLLALLHDLGHGPFGHALDNYVGYMNRYQEVPNPDKVYSRLYVEKYLSTTLKNLGFDPDELMRILNPEDRASLAGFDSLIGDLIDSPMDMDRMDYLKRDAHMTGLNVGSTNADALIQCVRPVRSGESYLLAYDQCGLEYMEHLLYAREAMYGSCYEHPRKRAAERMLERLVRIVAEDDASIIDDLYLLTDEELLVALRLVSLASNTAKRLLEQLVSNSEYVLVHDVQASSASLSDEARLWVRKATLGKGKASYVDQPAQWEDVIARASLGAEYCSEIQVIVAPPSAYEQKFSAATILLKDNRVFRTKEFFEVATGVKNVLSAMNPARARIKVMCSGDLSEANREKIKRAAVAELGS